MDPAAELAQHLIAGSGAGCIYGLLGLGFGLIYRASRVINFAHGEVMALGAFCALAGTEAGFGPVGGLALALPAAALASLAVGRLTAKVAGDGAPLAGIAVTAACAVLLRFAIETMPGWGTETHALESDFLAGTLAWGAVPIARADLAALAVTALILAGLALAGRVTRLGLALRAHIDDPRAAALTGVDPARMRDLAWLLAGALAAVVGVELFVFALGGLAGLAQLPSFGVPIDPYIALILGALLIGLVLAAAMPAGWLIRRSGTLAILEPFFKSWVRLKRQPLVLCKLAVLTVALFAANVAMFALAFKALAFKVPPAAGLLAAALSDFSLFVRIAPAAAGTFEGYVIYVVHLFGLTIAEGLVLAAVVRIAIVVCCVSLGPIFFYYLIRRRAGG